MKELNLIKGSDSQCFKETDILSEKDFQSSK